MPRLAVYSLTVCVLAAAAAVVSFVQGNWLGVVWVMLFGVSSNTAWYQLRKARAAKARPAARTAGARPAEVCETSGAAPGSCPIRCGACGES